MNPKKLAIMRSEREALQRLAKEQEDYLIAENLQMRLRTTQDPKTEEPIGNT